MSEKNKITQEIADDKKMDQALSSKSRLKNENDTDYKKRMELNVLKRMDITRKAMARSFKYIESLPEDIREAHINAQVLQVLKAYPQLDEKTARALITPPSIKKKTSDAINKSSKPKQSSKGSMSSLEK